jgi:hypothetical protein
MEQNVIYSIKKKWMNSIDYNDKNADRIGEPSAV